MTYRSGLTAALGCLSIACGGPATPAPEPISSHSAPTTTTTTTTTTTDDAAPSCEEVIDHLIQQLPDFMTVADRSTHIARCVEQPLSDELKRCLINVHQAKELMVCAKEEEGRGDEPDPPSNEAERNLEAIMKGAKSAFFDESAFPIGEMTLSPERDCCEYADGMCPPDPAVWRQPVWELLKFELDEPHRYRYSYQSDGRTMVAIARGDLDCDGVGSTYTIEGSALDGVPIFTVSVPTHAE